MDRAAQRPTPTTRCSLPQPPGAPRGSPHGARQLGLARRYQSTGADGAGETPVLVAVGQQAAAKDRQRLTAAGCEVIECSGESHADRLAWLLDELGRRQIADILVEGGGQVLGGLLDLGQIDEVHAFIGRN